MLAFLKLLRAVTRAAKGGNLCCGVIERKMSGAWGRVDGCLVYLAL